MPAAALAWALILAAMLPTPIYSAGTKITRFSAAKFVQRWTCPAHVKEIEVAMWGAAGGSTSASTRGGAGGFATGKITVSPGKSYSIVSKPKPHATGPAILAVEESTAVAGRICELDWLSKANPSAMRALHPAP